MAEKAEVKEENAEVKAEPKKVLTKAEKKAARKLAAEMLKKQHQRDYLAREHALDAETAKKLKDKWFDMFLRSKLPQMKENLRNVLDYMEKLVEVEAFRKKLFEEERIELSDQLNFQAQSHSAALENLYDIYIRRIRALYEAYREQVSRKKTDAEIEFERIVERETVTEENLKAILYQMELNQHMKEDAMKCEMFLKTDDEKSKNAEKSENLRVRLERVMERRWCQISSTLVDYQQSTEDRRKQYAQLKARDVNDSKIILSQMRKTQKLYDQIQQLKANLEVPYCSDKISSQISDFKSERSKFYNSFLYLKKIMTDELRHDDANLRQLTILSKQIIDYLNVILKKGERLLTLFSLCLKLETEKEKVVPVGRSLTPLVIPEYLERKLKLSAIHDFTAGSDVELAITSKIDDFTLFWQKVGKVRLSMLALTRVIADLGDENEFLKKLVHSYLAQLNEGN